MEETKKWKIAMLGHKSIPSREGGVEIVVEELSCGMVRRGHSVTCYNRTYPKVDRTKQVFQGVLLKYVWTIPHRGLAAVSASVVAALRVSFGNYDVVHFHAEGPCAMMWLPKLFGKKCVATIHGLDWQRSKWGKFASWYLRLGEWMATRCADEMIVLSQHMKDYFEDRYHRKTIYIPNGIPKLSHRPARSITECWGLQRGEYLLYLGRIVPEKGISLLIEAFQRVNTGKKLVIAGGASDTEGFYEEIKQKAQGDSRIVFTGFVQGTVLEELYSNAYLYCLPSYLEGMPLSLLEAMSYGLCCVTSDIPECTEITGKFGYHFAKGDGAQLCALLQKLIDQPELVSRQREECVDYMNRTYSWEHTVDKTLEVYDQVQNNGNGSREQV